MTRYWWSYFMVTPRVFRLIYTIESCFILEHYSYFFIRVKVSKFFCSAVNFFEVSMTSLLTFLGCLLLGIIFLNPCLFSTLYIWPVPMECPTSFTYAFSISLAVTICPLSAFSSNCFRNSFSSSKQRFLWLPCLFLFFNAFTESLYAFNHANTVDFPTSNF